MRSPQGLTLRMNASVVKYVAHFTADPNARYVDAFHHAYTQDGWKGASRRKVKPTQVRFDVCRFLSSSATLVTSLVVLLGKGIFSTR
jgi:hypothetical protein